MQVNFVLMLFHLLAHCGHRQALLIWSAGIRVRASALTATLLHQHSTSKLPVSAGAHWLAPPHSGQVRLGSGVQFMACSYRADKLSMRDLLKRISFMKVPLLSLGQKYFQAN